MHCLSSANKVVSVSQWQSRDYFGQVTARAVLKPVAARAERCACIPLTDDDNDDEVLIAISS